jgi:probable rRNA maturation factor
MKFRIAVVGSGTIGSYYGAKLACQGKRARMKAGQGEPRIEVRNAQRIVPIAMPPLQSFARIACALAWKHKRRNSQIASLDSIFVTVISDRQMARLHEQFSGLSGTTDVLTFHHGEIAISAEMARRQGREFHSTTGRELRLYILHGLLHLCGFNDHSAKQRPIMQKVQDEILALAIRREADESPRRRLNA